MKKVSLLLAAAALAWFTSCGGPGELLFVPTYSNMEDTYHLTEATVSGVPLAPSEISGAVVLRGRTYSIDITIPGMHHTRSGTYDLPADLADLTEDSVVATLDGGEDFLVIHNNGLKLSYRISRIPEFFTFEFTRS